MERSALSRMKQLLAAAFVCVPLSGCSSSTTSPSTPPTITKLISVTGNLAFGNVNLGSTAQQTFTISNSGNTVLAFTSFAESGGTGSAGFSATPTSGTVAPGGSVTVTVSFTPTLTQFYSNVLTVNGDQTNGNNAINVSGTGVNNNPIFTRSGTGNSVFTLPFYVTKVHIVGTYSGGSSTFVVWVGPPNVACGTDVVVGCSRIVNDKRDIQDDRTVSDGIDVVPAGSTQVTILDSAGVDWTFTEIR